MNPRSTPGRPGITLALAAMCIFLPIIFGEVGAQKPVEPSNPAASSPVTAEAIPVAEVPIQSTWCPISSASQIPPAKPEA
jgi:hypothetical protein